MEPAADVAVASCPQVLDVLASLDDPPQVVRLRRGQRLLVAGSEAEDVYVVLEGTLAVAPSGDPHESGAVVELGAGELVGEAALLAGGGRTGTVTAVGSVRVARIPGDEFTRLLDRDPDLGRAVAAQAQQRLRRQQLARHARQLLGEASATALTALEAGVRWVHLASGETLFHEGEIGDAAFLVLSGRLTVRVRTSEGERRVGDIGPGETVGEAALLDGVRTATVVAVRDSELAAIDGVLFSELLRTHPAAGLSVARTAARRATRATRPRRPGLSVAVVPLSGDVDVRMLTTRLAHELSGRGEVAHLWSARVDSRLGKPGIAQASTDAPGCVRLTSWLHDVEAAARFVLLEADQRASAWTQRALRWADRVLLVGAARSGPDATAEAAAAAATWLGAHPRATTLVLQHPAGATEPGGTARWLAEHPADEVHHLRAGSGDDLRRLARVLAGEATGLVLSGGGARGFAHLGVLRALEEHGVAVDLLGGTSMGAIIAGLASTERSADELIEVAAREFRKVLDYTVPLVSMVSGKRIVRGLRRNFGERDIEDLWRTYFCVSANLTRSEVVVHRRGSLVEAVRASLAIPGVIPPVPSGGDLLVDGGVLNNLPIDVLREMMPTGAAIAVDVTPAEGPRAKGDFGLSVSGGRTLAGKLLGRRSPAPGITRVLLRSMLVGAMRDRDRCRREGLADLYLDLDLRGIDMLEFDAVERVAAAGYEAASPRIERWLAERSAA